MMRPPLNNFTVLIALLVSGPAPFALGATAPAGAPVPAAAQPAGAQVTAADLQNPAIADPKEPAADCYITGMPQPPPDPARPRVPLKPCMGQADAFKRSAEAASYLAFYQQHFSDYGVQMDNKEKRAEIQADVAACLKNDQACQTIKGDSDDVSTHNINAQKMQSHLLAALVQYNFGKELKANLLESQTRAQNMATLDRPAEELRALGIAPNKIITRGQNRSIVSEGHTLRTASFMLNPKDVGVLNLDTLSPVERSKLGVSTAQFFDNFVNEYTSSKGPNGPKSRWHYVTAKTAAVGGSGQVTVIGSRRSDDGIGGSAAIDTKRLESDIKTQSSPVVEDIVASYKEGFKNIATQPKMNINLVDDKKNVSRKDEDSIKLAFQNGGFGQSRDLLQQAHDADPKDPNYATKVAQTNVVMINKAIYNVEKNIEKQGEAKSQSGLEFQRLPSSSAEAVEAGKSGKTSPSITVDPDSFGCFLDDIWPPGSPQPQKTECVKKN